MSGVKVTVTLNREIYKALRKLQGALIQATTDEWSLTSVINLTLLAGMASMVYLDPEKNKKFWEAIATFMKEAKQELELESLTDKVVNILLEKVFEQKENIKALRQKKSSSNLTM